MLKVTLHAHGELAIPPTFLTKIRKDERIDIPKIILDLLNRKSLPENCILDVTLEPA